MLRRAGHTDLADRIEREIVGRNVIPGRWTFQIVEEYDGTVLVGTARAGAARSATRLTEGRRHVYETEMKEQRRNHGHPTTLRAEHVRMRADR